MKTFRITFHWGPSPALPNGGYQWQTQRAPSLMLAIALASENPELWQPAEDAIKVLAWDMKACR